MLTMKVLSYGFPATAGASGVGTTTGTAYTGAD